LNGIDGAVKAEGIARGVDDVGQLLVESARGVEAVAAGEVTLRGSVVGSVGSR